MSTATDTLWAEADRQAGLEEPATAPVRQPIQIRRRRSYTPDLADPRARLHLVDDDGMRRWVYEAPASERLRRRARRAGQVWSGDIIRSFSYPDSTSGERGPNQVTGALVALDARLTPDQGMRRWDGDRFVADPAPTIAGRSLLLIHGTFSNNDMFVSQWAATPEGQAFWRQMQSHYPGGVLAFDHPTLSVGPWINALDLHAALRSVSGPIDVLAHSRGGLVASWWLRLAPSRAEQVIFVGSPLNGTSLASPWRLRSALDHLATIADLLAFGGEALSAVAPIAAGAAGLAKIFGRVLRLGANLPLADAAVALVPGLASQQRTDNNAELHRLFADEWLGKPRLSAVAANFQPSTSAPLWHVWERLRTAGAKAIASGAQRVFAGPNDLVVDRAAMSFLGTHQTLLPGNLLDLGSGSTWHTSYFRDPRVNAFLARQLN